MAIKKVSLTVDEELFDKFKDLSRRHGLKISTRFSLFVKNEVIRMETKPEDIDFYSTIPRVVEDIYSIEQRLEVYEKALETVITEQKDFHQKVLTELKLNKDNLKELTQTNKSLL